MITPDPSSSKRIVISAGKTRHFPLRPTNAPWLRYFLVGRGGTSGSGMPLDDMFPRSSFTFTYGTVGGGDQFATFAGLASDDVARMEIFTATGDRIPVPLRDNAYLIEVALARFPAKVVAYDAEGRVIGIERTQTKRRSGDRDREAHPETQSRRTRRIDGATHEPHKGGRRVLVRERHRHSERPDELLHAEELDQAPLRIGITGQPPLFIYGRARSDIERIEVRYSDRTKHAFAPGRDGYILEGSAMAGHGRNTRRDRRTRWRRERRLPTRLRPVKPPEPGG